LALPPLPDAGKDWSAWGAGVHDGVNGAAKVADMGTAGTATGDTLRAASGAWAPTDPKLAALPIYRLVSAFQSGHGWTVQGGAPGTITDDTAVFVGGSQSLAVSTTGSQGASTPTVVGITGLAPIDLTRYDVRLKLRLDNPGQIANFSLRLRAGQGVTTNYAERRFGPLAEFSSVGGAGQFSQLGGDGQWQTYTLSMAYRPNGNVGVPDLSKVTALGLALADTASGTPATVHIQEIALVPKATAAYPHGVVTFTWDDGYADIYTDAKPYLDRYGFPATAYIIRDVVGSTPGTYMSLPQLQSLQADGWEIACHAYSQANHDIIGGLNSLTDAQLHADFSAQKQWMLENGFNGADYSAYPQGRMSPRVVAAAARYFRSVRTTAAYDGLESVPPADPMRVRCITLSDSSGISLAQYKQIIDAAYDQGGWIIFYSHRVTSSPSGVQVTPGLFQSVVDYVAAKGVPVRTYGDVVRSGVTPIQPKVLPVATPADPADYSLTGWSMDPVNAGAGVTLTAAGVARGVRIHDTPGGVRSTIAMQVTTAGVGLANTYVAVYDSRGNRLGVSADVSTGSAYVNMSAAGAKRVPVGTFTVPEDGVIIALLLAGSATTLPAIGGANVGSTLNFDFPGTGKSNARSFTVGTALTAAPATIDPQAVTASNNVPWMATAL
jgi:peptidoglycan/xylan/chitin deacetylase (PgdA/CDA1 family)